MDHQTAALLKELADRVEAAEAETTSNARGFRPTYPTLREWRQHLLEERLAGR